MSKIYDLTNIRFGKLLVIEKTENPNNNKKQTYWLCKCDCGNMSKVTTTDLRSGKTAQCIKCAHIQTGLKRRKNLIGIKFGYLTVKEMVYTDGDKTKCLCDCDCGNTNILRSIDNLSRGNSIISCGCARKEISRISVGKDINGKVFGRLIVLDTYWKESPLKVKCKCECGNIVVLNKNDVQSNHTKSCGCLQQDMASLAVTKDWTGYISEYGVELICQNNKNKLGQWLWKCQCGLCGNLFFDLPARIANGHVTSCGCRKSSSKEKMIEDFLTNNNVEYKPQYSFKDCKLKYALRFDFAVFKDKKLFCLLEYDGKQHYESIEYFGGDKTFKTIQKRDKIKDKYCLNNNLNLLRLPYYLTDGEIKQKIINIIYP